MDQMMTVSAHVPTSARATKRPSAKASLRDSVAKNSPKKTRKNGMVVSTILFEPEMDEQLSALAFAWNTDRSALARDLITKGLSRYDVADEIRKAAERFKRGASGESDEATDRHDDGTDVSQESNAA